MDIRDLKNVQLVVNAADLREFAVSLIQQTKELYETKEPRYYTRKQMCELLGITLPTLHKYIKEGYLQPAKINGRLLFDAWAVDDAIRTRALYKGMRTKGGAR